MDLPYMPLWVKDWLSDPFVVSLGVVEEYCYLRLVMFCWVQGGKLPDDIDQLARLCKSPSHFKTRIWPKLSAKFGLIQPNIRCNPRVSEEIAKIAERHNRLSDAGKRGYAEKQARLKGGSSQAQASSYPDPYTDTSSDVSSETSSSPGGDESEIGILLQHVEHFNTYVAPKLGCQNVRKLTKDRAAKLRCRLTDYPDLWNHVIDEAGKLGQFAYEKRFIDFDFLMSPSKLQKFLEGKYRSREVQYGTTKQEAASNPSPRRTGGQLVLGDFEGAGDSKR